MNPDRRLLLFAPSPENGPFALQRRLLQGHEPAIEDRDLTVEVFFDGTEEAAAAHREFGVEPGAFAAVLVGKDGTAKLRSRDPVPPQDLFDLIDAMPMRRREIGRSATLRSGE